VSLQELLGDKRFARAFGEVQLEALGEERAAAHGVRAAVHALQPGMRVGIAPAPAPPTGLVTVGLEVSPVRTTTACSTARWYESERTSRA